MHRRKWPFRNLESGRALRITATVYLITSVVLLSFTIIAYFTNGILISGVIDSFSAYLTTHAPLILGAAYFAGLCLIGLLAWKCNHCRLGPGRRIATALKKMGQGDLGWKITLRRGDELANVAESVSQASESLADRISKLQIQTRQLTEVENYLIDSMDADGITNPYTLKALRKLKICTSRLNSNMEDFQISAIALTPPGSYLQQSRPAEELEKV